MKDRIWLSLAHMGGREQEFIQEAFDTNWVVPLGPNVNAFEKALRDFLIENGKLKVENEGKQVVALSAGTAALHLGLILLGVGEGRGHLPEFHVFGVGKPDCLSRGDACVRG